MELLEAADGVIALRGIGRVARNPEPERPYTLNLNPLGPDTRNPKPEIQNPKLETRNMKSETQYMKSETRNPRPDGELGGDLPEADDGVLALLACGQ